MAQEFTVNINVRATDSPSTEKDKFQQTANPMAAASSTQQTGDKAKDQTKDMLKGLNAKFAYRFVTSNANRIASSRISTIGLRYGDEALQNRVNNIYGMASQAAGTIGGMAMTAASGNYIALVVQLVGTLSTQILDIANKYAAFEIGEKQEDREIARQSERLGIVVSKGGR